MPILNLLKKLFKEEEKVETKEINFSDLGGWFNIELGKKRNEIENFLDVKKNDLQSSLQKVQESVKKLENAIPKRDINEKLKQIMFGNKETFINKVEQLIVKIKIPEKIEDILKFAEYIDKEMEIFSRSISKSYNVISEFFPQEAGNVSKNFIETDKIVKEIRKKIKDDGYDDLFYLMKKFSDIENKVKSLSKTKNWVENRKTDLKKTKDILLKKENELKEILQSADYKKYLSLTELKSETQREIIKIEGDFLHILSQVESALRKYEKNTENKIIGLYLKDPIGTLLGDVEIQISDLIIEVKKAIIRGQIDIKDKKKDKVLRELGKLNKDYFINLFNKRNELLEKFKILMRELGEIKIINELKKVKGEIAEIEEKVKNMIREIEKISKEQTDTDFDAVKKELEKEIHYKIKKDIKII